MRLILHKGGIGSTVQYNTVREAVSKTSGKLVLYLILADQGSQSALQALRYLYVGGILNNFR